MIKPTELSSFSKNLPLKALKPKVEAWEKPIESTGLNQILNVVLYEAAGLYPSNVPPTKIGQLLMLRVLTMTEAELREVMANEFESRVLKRMPPLDRQGHLKSRRRTKKTDSMRVNKIEIFFSPPDPIKSVPIKTGEFKIRNQVFLNSENAAMP